MRIGPWRISGWRLVGAGALLLLTLFLLYPTLRLTAASVLGGEYYREFFSRPYYYGALRNSLGLSVAATLISLLIGVPLAVLVSRYQIPGKRLIWILAVLSLLSPPFIGAYAWIILLGRAGLITRALGLDFSLYGVGGVLLLFVLHHFAYVFLLTSAALERVDPALEEAAESLGSPPWRRLLTVTLPLALPAMAAGSLLVFTTTLADFAVPILIGEGLRTLPVLIYDEFLSELGGSHGMASAASAITLAVALGALLLHGGAVGRRSYAMQPLRRPVARPLPPFLGAAAAGLALAITTLAALPQAVVLVTSFLKMRGPLLTAEFSLENYRLMLSRMAGPIGNTLWYGLVAVALMLVLGMLIAYLLVRRPGLQARLLDGLLLLSQVLPGTVLGIALLTTWNRPPLALTGTGAILIIAYVMRRIAFTARAAAAGLKQIGPAVEEASLTLGARPGATFRQITVPLMLPAALAGALVSWVSTIGELSSTIMLYTGRTATVSVLIYNQVLADSFGPAAALGSVLTLLTLISLWLLSRWADGKAGFGWQ